MNARLPYGYMALAALLLTIIIYGLLKDPLTIHWFEILSPPTSAEWLGYDDLGRSIAARLGLGAVTAFVIAAVVVVISAIIGISIGFLSAYLGGWQDALLVRVMDIFLAFPGLLLAIALAGILGPGLVNLLVALIVVGWVGYARLVRAQVLSLRTREYVMAAEGLGVARFVIFYRHILPFLWPSLKVEATFGLAGAILAEAGLSFLGLGIQPPNPSWGQMIREGAQYLLVAPHFVLFPSLALWATVLLLNRLGDAGAARSRPSRLDR